MLWGENGVMKTVSGTVVFHLRTARKRYLTPFSFPFYPRFTPIGELENVVSVPGSPPAPRTTAGSSHPGWCIPTRACALTPSIRGKSRMR